MLGQYLAGPADQPGGGLAARGGDDGQVQQQLFAVQPTPGARLILEFRIEQIGHDVVGRMLGPPVQEVREHFAGGQCLDLLGLQGGFTMVGDVAAGRIPRDAQQHADDAHRHLCAKVFHEVEPAGPDQGIEAARGELADPGSSASTLRGVNTRDNRLR